MRADYLSYARLPRMKRWIRAPARPSVVASKSAVFARNLRHLRRRGTSLYLLCLRFMHRGPAAGRWATS
jgi:hypothetical protein